MCFTIKLNKLPGLLFIIIFDYKILISIIHLYIGDINIGIYGYCKYQYILFDISLLI